MPMVPETEYAELEGMTIGCPEVTVATAEDVNVTVTTTVESDSVIEVAVELIQGKEDVLTGLAVSMAVPPVPVSAGPVVSVLLFQPTTAELEMIPGL